MILKLTKTVRKRPMLLKSLKKLGWTTGIEPATTGITIRPTLYRDQSLSQYFPNINLKKWLVSHCFSVTRLLDIPTKSHPRHSCQWGGV